MNRLTGFFDFDYNDNKNCSKIIINNFKKEDFVNNLNNIYNNKKISLNTKYFAFPLTNNKEYYLKQNNNDNNILEKKVNEEIFDFEKNPDDKIEVVLNIEKEKKPELKINLKYNEQLVKERKALENKDSLFDNILLIHLSGVSQFYFKKALPKIYSLIESYDYKKQNKDNNMSMESFLFEKYHSFNNDSFINDFLMYHDSDINSIKDIKNKLINNQNIDINVHLKYFKDNGYITGQTIDVCNDAIKIDYLKSKNTFWDYELL